MHHHRTKGFTLIELLIVVAIIGILAAIAIPNLLNALSRARQKRTMANMRNIGLAWEARATDTGRYNAAGLSVDGMSFPVAIPDLVAALQPTYMKNVPTQDGWSVDFVFLTNATFNGGGSAQHYGIVSGGRDGVVATTPVMGPTNSFDCDIIYANGSFLAYPEGIQTER
ncbi:MAG: prepilin-type N-terminal cleavage/methylation domain-containing protein [Thermoanaerobaculia bacterium]